MDAATEQLLAQARAWRDADSEAETRGELTALIEGVERTEPSLNALQACFEPPLTFGTAGLRGLKGPGPAHMNHLLIQRVTAVITDVLRAEVPDAAERGVVVAYDARHGSKELAETAARTIAGAGLGVHVFDDYAPTPLAAFATLELEAAAGLVLTASHNPPAYLGYKVYWSNGAQLVSPIDQRIAQALNALPLNAEIPLAELGQARTHGNEMRAAYLKAISRPPHAKTPIKIAYSAMHGVGGALIKAALAHQGAVELHEVTEQAAPDGDFPTVNFPNPEEPGALDRLTKLATEINADIAIATDPDADRLAVAIPDDQGDWQVLMGDQTGALMGDYLLDAATRQPPADAHAPDPTNLFVINTVVSSKLLGRIAAYYGVQFEQTLTGFKWIWHRALQKEAMGERLVFAYEDAIGFCPTRRVRDKDGIAAAVVIAELARETKAAGLTLHQRLNQLYARYGLSVNRQVSIQLEGADAQKKMNAQLEAIRRNPPVTLAGLTVTRVHDYEAAESFRPDGTDREPIPLPSTNLVQLELVPPAPEEFSELSISTHGLDKFDNTATRRPVGQYYVSLRPSGTEPKLKIYLEYLGKPLDRADSKATTAENLYADAAAACAVLSQLAQEVFAVHIVDHCA
mgnify:CR=1 FL=1